VVVATHALLTLLFNRGKAAAERSGDILCPETVVLNKGLNALWRLARRGLPLEQAYQRKL
jgi:hypothetical protein